MHANEETANITPAYDSHKDNSQRNAITSNSSNANAHVHAYTSSEENNQGKATQCIC